MIVRRRHHAEPGRAWKRTALLSVAFAIGGSGIGWAVQANAGTDPVGSPSGSAQKEQLRANAASHGFAGKVDPMVAYLADCLTAKGQNASYFEEDGHGRMLYGGDPQLITACFKQLEVLK